MQIIKNLNMAFDESKYCVIEKGYKEKTLIVYDDNCKHLKCFNPVWTVNTDILIEKIEDRLLQYFCCTGLLDGSCSKLKKEKKH